MNGNARDDTARTKKLLRLGTDQPRCARCKTTEEAVLCRIAGPGKASGTVLCHNCRDRRGKLSPKASTEKARRFADAGYFKPACVICDEPMLQILERDHVAHKANSDLIAPLCGNHHAIKSHMAETGPMAALRLGDPERRALVLQAAFEFGLAAILAMFAVWEGADEQTARAVFFGLASAGLFAWATWNLAADEHFAGAYGLDYDRGGPAPTILRAIRAVPKGRRYSKTTRFRGAVELRSTEPFFETIVEQRQIAKRGAEDDADLAALEIGLKQISASGGYGVHAEINVSPGKDDNDLPGGVYSDIAYLSPKVHDERPGAFANPIIATLVTGGARLMLALLESEVRKRGGTYAFCDTDSLAVNCGDPCPEGIPSLPETEVAEIVAQFDVLNPYDREVVPHLLKVEHPEYPDLRCFAVSAKRYVLYRWRPGNRIQIVKASESALGAIIGRSRNETTRKLAQRIWLLILMRHLNVNAGQRHRAKPLIDFDVPLRRKFPISQPAILKRLEAYNKPRSYDFRVKPFGFVQTISPDRQTGENDVLPIAPFETDVRKSMKLQWVDFNSGDPIRLDWHRTGMASTIGVMRLADYIDDYQRHPEAKAADRDGNPAGPETIGLLARLRVRSRKLARIGKEVDRLDEEEGAALEPEQPVEYERDDLAQDIEYLANFPQAATARDLGLTERGWRKIIKLRPNSKVATVNRIREVAAAYRVCSGERCACVLAQAALTRTESLLRWN
jgi:hypothetical protein